MYITAVICLHVLVTMFLFMCDVSSLYDGNANGNIAGLLTLILLCQFSGGTGWEMYIIFVTGTELVPSWSVWIDNYVANFV